MMGGNDRLCPLFFPFRAGTGSFKAGVGVAAVVRSRSWATEVLRVSADLSDAMCLLLLLERLGSRTLRIHPK